MKTFLVLVSINEETVDTKYLSMVLDLKEEFDSENKDHMNSLKELLLLNNTDETLSIKGLSTIAIEPFELELIINLLKKQLKTE